MNTPTLYTRSKIWLEDAQGNVVFGLGRYRMLEAVQRLGSINAAAKELKMGYRAVWARIHATEERLGQDLLVKKTGGSTGGGSRLTPLAEALVQRFESIRQCVENETDTLFEQALGEQLDLNRDRS
ncbi:MAG: LysR family transcriptional regulator [Thermodesulfobacteriota bacterium]|nr:LysR family transcriptional regulator [Thermodesulfobacteriota bacterium]